MRLLVSAARRYVGPFLVGYAIGLVLDLIAGSR